jgi:hypothetical protein
MFKFKTKTFILLFASGNLVSNPQIRDILAILLKISFNCRFQGGVIRKLPVCLVWQGGTIAYQQSHLLCGFSFQGNMLVQWGVLQRTMLQRTNATTNECYNELMLQQTNGTTNECYNKRMLQQTNATTNEFYNERCYNEQMLQRTNATMN